MPRRKKADAPVFESPVVKSYPPASSDLTLTDESATTKWLVRGNVGGAVTRQRGVNFGTSSADGKVLVLGTRPGEWLLLGDNTEVKKAVKALPAGANPKSDSTELISAVDWTHGRAMFRLTGTKAPQVLEKICSLDWSDPMTPDGAVASASVAKVTCDIARNDQNGTPSYIIFCDRSFGQYLFDAILDSAAEFQIKTNR